MIEIQAGQKQEAAINFIGARTDIVEGEQIGNEEPTMVTVEAAERLKTLMQRS